MVSKEQLKAQKEFRKRNSTKNSKEEEAIDYFNSLIQSAILKGGKNLTNDERIALGSYGKMMTQQRLLKQDGNTYERPKISRSQLFAPWQNAPIGATTRDLGILGGMGALAKQGYRKTGYKIDKDARRDAIIEDRLKLARDRYNKAKTKSQNLILAKRQNEIMKELNKRDKKENIVLEKQRFDILNNIDEEEERKRKQEEAKRKAKATLFRDEAPEISGSAITDKQVRGTSLTDMTIGGSGKTMDKYTEPIKENYSKVKNFGNTISDFFKRSKQR